MLLKLTHQLKLVTHTHNTLNPHTHTAHITHTTHTHTTHTLNPHTHGTHYTHNPHTHNTHTHTHCTHNPHTQPTHTRHTHGTHYTHKPRTQSTHTYSIRTCSTLIGYVQTIDSLFYNTYLYLHCLHCIVC